MTIGSTRALETAGRKTDLVTTDFFEGVARVIVAW
jgi:hypothetical protein